MNIVRLQNAARLQVMRRAPLSESFELYKVDNCGIRFQLRYTTGFGFGKITLASSDKVEDLYEIAFGPVYCLRDCTNEQRVRFSMPVQLNSVFQEFTLTWYNNLIQLNYINGTHVIPVIEYSDDQISPNHIGYIKFYTKTARHITEWLIDYPEPNIVAPKNKIFKHGQFNWVPVTEHSLPENALIGGFEEEPIYVARSFHNGSLCPGKYIPSHHKAYIPWGHNEHEKEEFEILCGYNGKWVKTSTNAIPENALVAGYSEVRREPLYIGRAKHEGYLITGKVHVLYNKCFLPYKGAEIEVQEYEILVTMDTLPRAEEPMKKRKKNVLMIL